MSTDLGAHVDLAQRIANLEIGDALEKTLDDLIVDAALDVHPFVARAHLAAVGKARDHRCVDGLFDVRVVEDDEGRLAAELESEHGDVVRGCLEKLGACSNASGEADELGDRVAHQLLAGGSAVARNYVDDSGRRPTSWMTCTRTSAGTGVRLEGLSTMVFLVTRAGASLRPAIAMGKFQAAMPTVTP